jgi:hypothetical protein
MPAAYPTESEVTTKMVELGLTVPSNIAGILAGVIEDFEQLTGYVPFLADASDTVWDFDPPYLAKDLTLDLAGGFTAITSITINGSAIDSTGYDKLKLNAADESQGWTSIRFRSHPGTTPASVQITGKRGLYTAIPNAVYEAILAEATGRASLSVAGASGDVTKVKMGQMEVTMGASDSQGRTGYAKTAAAQFERVIMRYRRLVI